jgi:hypothetical protein
MRISIRVNPPVRPFRIPEMFIPINTVSDTMVSVFDSF